jgi:hypothetical protein
MAGQLLSMHREKHPEMAVIATTATATIPSIIDEPVTSDITTSPVIVPTLRPLLPNPDPLLLLFDPLLEAIGQTPSHPSQTLSPHFPQSVRSERSLASLATGMSVSGDNLSLILFNSPVNLCTHSDSIKAL